MTPEEMKARTKAFAREVVALVEKLPNTRTARHFGGQLLRAGTSVAANYRAACRGRSRADFVAKLGIVEEEADESTFWLEMLVETGILPQERTKALHREGSEILAIVVASIKSARK